jgi:glutamyl-tRNA reductase
MSIAVVGMDFREGPSTIRAQLKAIDDSIDSPTSRLRETGLLDGVVRVESCSRVEWVLSAAQPGWSAELLRGTFLKRLKESGLGRRMHVKLASGALHYLMRMTLGLESVAEGEHAIGRQVLKAFEGAHGAGSTDRDLHLCWHALGRLLQTRKETGVGSSVGVQSLVVNELSPLPRTAPVLLLGRGEIGRQVDAALQRGGFQNVSAFPRAELPTFFRRATEAAAVVVATGGPAAWLELPQRTDWPFVVDVGAPPQVRHAEGWRWLSLDALLTRRGLLLDAESLATLDALSDEAAIALREALESAQGHHVLKAIQAEKEKFFEGDVDAVLAELSPKEARRVAEALRGFTHRLLEVTRRASRDA